MISLIVYLLLWSSFYFALQYYNKQSSEWNSRIVAMTHAFVICRCIEYCMFTGPWLFHSFGEMNTNPQNVVIYLTTSYFLFEICWCLYMRTEGILMMLHHLISLSAMIGSLITQNSAAEVLLTTWGSEITNPFLQIRWFLRETDYYGSTYAYANDFMFIVLFFLVRVCLGSVVAWYLYYSTKTVFLMKVGGYSFYFLSLLWMYKVYGFAIKRLSKVKKVKI